MFTKNMGTWVPIFIEILLPWYKNFLNKNGGYYGYLIGRVPICDNGPLKHYFIP